MLILNINELYLHITATDLVYHSGCTLPELLSAFDMNDHPFYTFLHLGGFFLLSCHLAVFDSLYSQQASDKAFLEDVLLRRLFLTHHPGI